VRKRSSFTLPEIFEPAGRGWNLTKELSPCPLEFFEFDRLHYHDSLELGLCISGRGECRIGNESFSFGPGDVQIIFPFQRHLSKSSGNEYSRWHFLNIDPVMLLSAWNHGTSVSVEEIYHRQMGLYGIFHPTEHPYLAQLITRIIQINASTAFPTPGRTEYLCAGLYALIMELSRASAHLPKLSFAPSRRFLALKPALSAIEKGLSLGSIPSVAELAKLCRMSEASFRRAFHDAVGQSPGNYVTLSRIRRAQSALISSDQSILEISLASGFDDPSGFYRSFRDRCGMSPSAFRKAFRLNAHAAAENLQSIH